MRKDPTIDLKSVPGGWLGAELAEDEWRLPVPVEVEQELLAAVEGSPEDGLRPFDDAMPHTAALATEVRLRLRSEGFVVLTGFPVEAREQAVERMYLMLGLQLGCPVSQSRNLDYVGRVEDRGSDIGVPTQRGYQSAAALPFHCDRTDLIGLLCIRTAREGGKSRLVSSVAIHNLLLEERPELLEVLYGPLPNDRRGEEREGAPRWTPMPVFGWSGSSFSARYVRRFIEGSQRHLEAPRLTSEQLAAMDVLDELLERPGVSLDMDLRPGDLQLIDNSTILHARSAFTGAAEGGTRLLLRLWLATPDSPELPPEYLPLYGATEAGSYRGGVWPSEAQVPEVGTPVTELHAMPACLRQGKETATR